MSGRLGGVISYSWLLDAVDVGGGCVRAADVWRVRRVGRACYEDSLSTHLLAVVLIMNIGVAGHKTLGARAK